MLKPLPIECEDIFERLRAVKPYVYLASPYSKFPGGVDEAFEIVSAAAGYLIKEGVKLFCPISHSHPIAVYGHVPVASHGIWLPVDQPFIDGAGAICIVLMESWATSYGIGYEIDQFRDAEKPEFYFRWPR